MTTTDARSPPAGQFIAALGLRDVVLMNVVAIVGLRWITRGARAGAPSVTLWILACLVFFVPLALILSELASRHPDQGGLYAWTRRAFGPRHGFVCGWCLWVNNLFYFPALLLFAASNALVVFGDRYAGLAESPPYSVGFVLVTLWLCVGINIIGLRTSRWLQNIGSIGTWVPALLLIAIGAVTFVMFGSATSFAPAELVPTEDFMGTLALWSAMCFAFSGFEITAFVGQEVHDPRRTIPRGILIAGIATTVIYVLGSASVLIAVPADALAERSGIADAVEIVSARVGLAGLGALTGSLIALGALAGNSSWVAGAARVPFAAGVDKVMPAAFARLHPRYRTPHVALITQGGISSAVFLVSLFLSVTGGKTTVQESYDILVNLTILIYFIPYLYLFLSATRLRPSAVEGPDVIRVPGGIGGLRLVAGAGFCATFVALALTLVPPAGTINVLNYEANLVVQAAVVLLAGGLLYRSAA